jgi:hypothetical protein
MPAIGLAFGDPDDRLGGHPVRRAGDVNMTGAEYWIIRFRG